MANYAQYGPRYPKGTPGGLGGRLISQSVFNKQVAGRMNYRGVSTGLHFGPGSAFRSGAAWAAHASPFALLGGAAGAGLGGFIGLTQGGPGGMTTGAAIGGGVGLAAGTAGFAFARPLAGGLGKAGLSAAGILGGGAEMMFGIGSKAAKGTALMMGDAAVGAGGRMGVRAAGGLIGGAIGGLVGGTGGAAMLGTAMGALTGPRLRNMSGGVMGLAMRHPMAAIIGAGVAAAGLRSGGRVLRHMLAGDRPSRVGEGSWGEVYGMSSNHNNTAGLGLAMHYNR